MGVLSRFCREALSAGVDARRVARLRIVLGLVILVDLLARLRDFYAFYDEAGVVPRRFAEAWSVFAWSHSRAWAIAVYGVLLLATTAYALGLATRSSGVLTLVLLRSLHWRSPLIFDGGDSLLDHLLLWMQFADAGSVWSLDVRLGWRARKDFVWGLPLRIVQLQLSCIYVQAAYKKWSTGWAHLDAVQQALAVTPYTRNWAMSLVDHPFVCRLLTAYTLVAESLFVPLVWSGAWRLRRVGLALGAGLHAGIFLLMRVGIFSPAILVGYLAFWPRGKTSQERQAVSPWLRGGLLATVALSAVLAVGGSKVPAATAWALQLGVEQRWYMFTPPPASPVRWRAPGTLTDGAAVEVLASTVPELAGGPGFFYRRWLTARFSWSSTEPDKLFALTTYLCRRYNQTHAVPLAELRIEAESRSGEWDTVVTQKCTSPSLVEAPIHL